MVQFKQVKVTTQQDVKLIRVAQYKALWIIKVGGFNVESHGFVNYSVLILSKISVGIKVVS